MKKIFYLLFVYYFLISIQALCQSVTQIGFTTYDLQTKGSAGRKLINYENGKLAAVWSFAPDFTVSDPMLGTGFNYFNGTTWLAAQSTRCEPMRTGAPSISRIGQGREAIVSHLDSPFDFEIGKNLSSGSTSFIWSAANASLIHTPSNTSTYNCRIASSGVDSNTIHLISVYADTNIVINGIHAPFVYSRSNDAGANWPVKAIFLPGYDSTRTKLESPDTYDIDASGNNVAIVLGGLAHDVSLWTSVNNGTSFSKTVIDTFLYAPDMLSLAPYNDTDKTNDGSVSVMVDGAGHSHVAFARSRIVKQVSGSGGDTLVFFPNSIGLVYWDDISHTKINIPISLAQLDANGDGVYSIGRATTALHTDISNGIFGAARYGLTSSLLTQPSIAMDASGAIYIIFSLPADGDSTADGQSFRDVWAVKSTTNGLTWSCPVNITHSAGIEEAFPCVAKWVDNNIHILFQEDFEPGTRALNGDENDQQLINYMSVNKNFSDVFAPVISVSGPLCGSGLVFLSCSTSPNYLWTGGSTAQGISVAVPGWYKVSTTNACGFTGIDSVYIDHEPTPIAHISVIGDTSFCLGSPAVILKADNSLSYRWSNGAITQQISLSTIPQSGTYKVTTFNLCNDSVVSQPVHVLISAIPANPVISYISGGFSASPSGMIYQWYLNGLAIPGETAQTFIPANPAITIGKNISVMITDINGCSANSTSLTSTEEREGARELLQVYPNPAKDKFNIYFGKNTETIKRIELTDVFGRKIYTETEPALCNELKTLDVSELKSGIYILKIICNTREEEKKVLIY